MKTNLDSKYQVYQADDSGDPVVEIENLFKQKAAIEARIKIMVSPEKRTSDVSPEEAPASAEQAPRQLGELMEPQAETVDAPDPHERKGLPNSSQALAKTQPVR